MSEANPHFLVTASNGNIEYSLPISVKAVILWQGQIPLLKNERDEWELPGGKIDPGEEPETALARELREELGWDVKVGEIVHAWVYPIRPDRHVFVVGYRATYDGDLPPQFSHEHKALRMVHPEDIEPLNMPKEYKRAIALALKQ